jgi:branched-chain amino acid transport system permease protein
MPTRHWERKQVVLVLQLGINGIDAGIIYSLVAVGFSLIFGTTRVFHVAQGATFVIAEYVFWWLTRTVGIPVPAAVVLTLIAAGGFGVAAYVCLYDPMRKRGHNSFFSMFVASLGLLTVVQNGIDAIFGPNGASVKSAVVQGRSVGGLVIAPITYIEIAVALVAFGSMRVLMRYSRAGTGLRATASDPELMDSVGEGRRRYDIMAFALGSMLVVPAAVLNLYANGAAPTDGINITLIAFTATIVGGVGSLLGGGIAALLIGVVENVAIWKISSAWSEGVVFIVLIVFLVIRPAGILKSSRT